MLDGSPFCVVRGGVSGSAHLRWQIPAVRRDILMSTFNIKPYPRVAVYPTSWAGEMMFQQIYDDLAHYTSNVMKNFGVMLDELPDCLQIGFMALWEMLVEQRDFLAEKTRKQTVFFILARCKISTIRYQANQYDSLDALINADWHNTADEHVIDGMQHQQGERWAGWATEIDMRIDIERIMHKLAAKYEPSLKHLVALYYLTTQVGKEDAAHIVTTDVWRWFQKYGIPVQKDVQYEFAEVFLERHSYEPAGELVLVKEHPNHGRFTSPYREWREAYQQGNTAPANALLDRYAHTPCLVLALQAQIDGKTYQQAAEHYGRNYNGFKRHMKRAARLLKEAYAA